MNVVVLQGPLARPSSLRALPTGEQQLELELVTEEVPGAVPVVWPNPPAAFAAEPGEVLVVTGVVRRRFFRAGGATVSRTEVVASAVVPARRRAAAARAVEQAVAAVTP